MKHLKKFNESQEQLDLPFNTASFTYDDMVALAKQCIEEWADRPGIDSLKFAKEEVDNYIKIKQSL